MIDAMPIPGSDKLAAIFSPGHGNREHAGHVMLVDPDAGPDDPARARQVSPDIKMGRGWMGGREGFRDPYPLSEDCFLVARDKSLLILDGGGRMQEVYQAEKMLHEPRVIAPRPRERVIAPKSDPSQPTGRLMLADIYHGRKMQGVEPGEVKKLLVLEQLPKPVNFSGVQQTLSMNGTFTLKRILGTVPVETDGSAFFEVPALRSVYFAALDGENRVVKRMQSFITVMPGETVGCVGCHEHRTQTTTFPRDLAAMTRAPSRPAPIADVPDVIDYPRDVQPIWDRHCVECHSAEKPEGRVILTGEHNEWFTQSYYALFSSRQVVDSQGYDEDGNHPAREFGSAASPLMDKLDGDHYEAKLSAGEHRVVQLWIDTGATFPGTYAALRPGTPPSGHTRPDPGSFPPTYGTVKINATPGKVAYQSSGAFEQQIAAMKTEAAAGETEPVGAILKRRCMTCHSAKMPLGPGIPKTQTFLNVPRYCLNLYNLTRPEKSMILLAPLAKEAGGYGWCEAKPKEGGAAQPARVFPNTGDADYRSILAAIQVAKTQHDEMKRFDMPGFRPTVHYVREMKRYGILPAEIDREKDPIDVYAVDRAYWRSLWYQPPVAEPASPTTNEKGE
jgi:cytochrome c5